MSQSISSHPTISLSMVPPSAPAGYLHRRLLPPPPMPPPPPLPSLLYLPLSLPILLPFSLFFALVRAAADFEEQAGGRLGLDEDKLFPRWLLPRAPSPPLRSPPPTSCLPVAAKGASEGRGADGGARGGAWLQQP